MFLFVEHVLQWDGKLRNIKKIYAYYQMIGLVMAGTIAKVLDQLLQFSGVNTDMAVKASRVRSSYD